MRPLALCALSLLAAACGRGEVVVSGTLADGADADSVWVFDDDARAGIEADSFEIRAGGGDLIDLRFVGDDGRDARMEIREWPGGRIHLGRIWLEDGVAYASAVRLDRPGTVTINGVRMSDPDRMPGEVDAEAVVLAASRSGDALLVRPMDAALPDLRVVVTPGTEIASPDGDPAGSGAVQPGDTVTVRGTVEAGYLVAAALTVPRRVVVRESPPPRLLGWPVREREDDDKDEKKDEDEKDRRGRGRGRGRGGG